ncbi:hypothetical protein [Dietzia sp.]|uniref:hypothetical protein n=1 Tax=Dietzia sp. TaxID=1871616 RepID=UPI002FDACABF
MSPVDLADRFRVAPSLPDLPSRRRGLRARSTSFVKNTNTTPGRLVLFTLVIVILVLVAGLYTAATAADRKNQRDLLLAEIEPVANASQTLYSSLSIADSAANTAFLTGGVESPELRDRYNDAIGTSSAAIIAATQSLETSDGNHTQSLAEINADLAVYTGLVETARANNRIGNPVGSAYLASASSLMQDQILPEAADLFDAQSSSVQEFSGEWSSPPWLSLIALALATLLLVLLQLWLRRVTGRKFNLGLGIATILVIIAFVWTALGGFLMASGNSRGLSEGAAPMSELTRTRIWVQQARAQETLDIVRRTDPVAASDERTRRMAEIRRTLSAYLDSGANADVGLDADGAVTNAVNALDAWQAAQRQADSLYQQGDYKGATAASTGQGPGQSGAAFDQLDSALVDAIEKARDRLRTVIDEARATSDTTPDAVRTLTVVAIFLSIAGIAPRVREYL